MRKRKYNTEWNKFNDLPKKKKRRLNHDIDISNNNELQSSSVPPPPKKQKDETIIIPSPSASPYYVPFNEYMSDPNSINTNAINNRTNSCPPSQQTPPPLQIQRQHETEIKKRQYAIKNSIKQLFPNIDIDWLSDWIICFEGGYEENNICNYCRQLVVYKETCIHCNRHYCYQCASYHGQDCYKCGCFRDNYCKQNWYDFFSICPHCWKKRDSRFDKCEWDICYSTPESTPDV